MPLAETVGLVAEAVTLVKEVANHGKRHPSRASEFRYIIESLRAIYFIPKGTRNILKCLADGNQPNQIDVEKTLPNFNDAEWRVGRMVERLDFEALDRIPGLSLRQRRVLNEISWGKRSIRRDVQEALNDALTHGGTVPPHIARQLLDRVNELNHTIESIEEEFL
jgi:hypothetical protein